MAAVLLDVGGTLWPDRWPLSRGGPDPRVARLTDLVPGFTPALWLPLQEALSRTEPEAGAPEDGGAAVRAALQEIGVEVPGVGLETLRRGMCRPACGAVDLFPGARKMLATIKGLGLVCVVVSNALWRDGTCYRRDFEEFGVSAYIDLIVSSVDVGRRKPDPAILAAAVAAARCDAGRCVMVGNSEQNDIMPALSMGMRAIRVAIEEPLPGVTAAEAVVASLGEAAGVLRGIARGERTGSQAGQ